MQITIFINTCYSACLDKHCQLPTVPLQYWAPPSRKSCTNYAEPHTVQTYLLAPDQIRHFQPTRLHTAHRHHSVKDWKMLDISVPIGCSRWLHENKCRDQWAHWIMSQVQYNIKVRRSNGLPSNLDVSLSAQMPNTENIAPDFIGGKTNSSGSHACQICTLN